MWKIVTVTATSYAAARENLAAFFRCRVKYELIQMMVELRRHFDEDTIVELTRMIALRIYQANSTPPVISPRKDFANCPSLSSTRNPPPSHLEP